MSVYSKFIALLFLLVCKFQMWAILVELQDNLWGMKHYYQQYNILQLEDKSSNSTGIMKHTMSGKMAMQAQM